MLRRGAGVGERRNNVIIGAGDADTDRVAPGSRLSFRSGEAALALGRDTGIACPGRATPAFAGGAKIRDPGATRSNNAYARFTAGKWLQRRSVNLLQRGGGGGDGVGAFGDAALERAGVDGEVLRKEARDGDAARRVGAIGV
jgi:hypothetical protein